MRTAIAVVVVVLVPAWALAAPPDKMYYLGEVKLSSAAGQPLGSQVILVEKVHDRDNATIVERALDINDAAFATEAATTLIGLIQARTPAH